jgi:hypothetical protein
MRSRARTIAAFAAAAAVLGGVFALYARPDVMVMLAEQVWLCFQ